MGQLKRQSVLSAVRQSWIAIALAFLWCAAGPIEAWAKPPAAYPLQRSLAEERIFKTLHEETNMDFVEQPLSDVIQYLQDLHKIDIQLHKKSLEDAGVSSDVTITRNIKNVSLGNALTLMLDDLDLDFIVAHDVLLIVTKEWTEEAAELRLYNIKDLITGDRSSQSIGEMIQKMFAEDSDHHLQLSPVGEVLVIRDTQRGHSEIEVLLETLRVALAGDTQPAAQALSAPASNAPRAPEITSASQSSAAEPAAADDADRFDSP